jgi:hypothetical protein
MQVHNSSMKELRRDNNNAEDQPVHTDLERVTADSPIGDRIEMIIELQGSPGDGLYKAVREYLKRLGK